MVYILASKVDYYFKDENGLRQPKIIDDKNLILTNLKKHLKKRDNFLIIANEQDNYEGNDARVSIFKKALELTDIPFKNYHVLDSRTIKKSKELISKADYIHIPGGTISSAQEFYDKISLGELLKNKQSGVISGVSAGAMFLTKNIFSFPEYFSEIPHHRYINGYGTADIIYIPHFDGENKKYQEYAELDVVNGWILPYSKKQKMYGFPDGSYAMLSDNKLTFYGDVYEIYKGKIKKINK